MHTKQICKGEDVFHICEEKYRQLIQTFRAKFDEAKVGEFLAFTTLTKLKRISGKNVFVMSKTVLHVSVSLLLVYVCLLHYFLVILLLKYVTGQKAMCERVQPPMGQLFS